MWSGCYPPVADPAFRLATDEEAARDVKVHITSGWVAVGIAGWALFVAALPATGNAGVITEDEFLLRTTGDLVELCKAAPTDSFYTAAINFCHGFSTGVYRVLEEESRAGSRHVFCLPDPPPHRNDAIAAFVQWADANPDQKNQLPTDGIATYLTKKYPCAGGKR
jgi:hypothetical protein